MAETSAHCPRRCAAHVESDGRACSRTSRRGTTAFTCVSISSEKRYVAPIELFLKKAGLTSSIATFPGDGEGQCFVSDLPAEQVVTNLAAVGIPAEVVEH